MKGSLKDLRIAEDLAEKGRVADAIKVIDRILGVANAPDSNARIAALTAAILSNDPMWTDDDMNVVDRGDGKSEITLSMGRLKVPSEMVGLVLVIRQRWLISWFDATRTQEAIQLYLRTNAELVEVLKDPNVGARLSPGDMASLLSMATDPFFIINDHEMVAGMIQSAMFRAPVNDTMITILRTHIERLRANASKGPSPNLEKYRAGLAALEPMLAICEVALSVVGSGPIPDADTIKRRVAERLSQPKPAPAAAATPPPAAPEEKKGGFLSKLFGKK